MLTLFQLFMVAARDHCKKKFLAVKQFFARIPLVLLDRWLFFLTLQHMEYIHANLYEDTWTDLRAKIRIISWKVGPQIFARHERLPVSVSFTGFTLTGRFMRTSSLLYEFMKCVRQNLPEMKGEAHDSGALFVLGVLCDEINRMLDDAPENEDMEVHIGSDGAAMNNPGGEQ